MSDKSEFICEKCNKCYASKSSLCNHNKKFHYNKDELVNKSKHKSKPKVNIKSESIKCDICEKIYKHKHVLSSISNSNVDTTIKFIK